MKTFSVMVAGFRNVLPVCNWQGRRANESARACLECAGVAWPSAGFKPAARLLLAVMLIAFNAGAADVLTEKLQRGLFEEEANHNLDAAIKEYQSVVAQSDEQRKVTATALFRLGECYRKLGRTNEANAQYQRILRDFSEQEQVVKLSRDLLPRSSAPLASIDTVTNPVAVNLLREEIRVVEQSVQAKERLLAAGRAMLSDVVNAKKEVLRLKRRLPENAVPSQQRRLLEEQIEIVKQHLADIEKRASDRRVPSEELSIQRELLSLQRELAVVSDGAGSFANETVTGRSAESELVRELERRQARLQGELSEARSRFNVLSRMSRNQLLQSASQFFKDPVLTDLQQQLQAAEQKLAVLKTQFGGEHPDVKAAETLRQRLDEQQIPERLDSLLSGQRAQIDVLAAQQETVESELQRAKSQVSRDGSYSEAGLTQAEAEALARAKTLARNSPDLLQSPTRDGLGELQLGARDGFYSVVEFILAQGVNANGPERGTPPLVLAAKGGHLRIVQLLLDKGADVNAMGAGNTALMSACESGYRAVVEVLLQRGADVNRIGSAGTALHKVAAKGYTGLAELLLQRGAKPDVAGNNKETPLHLAVNGGFTDVAESLLKAGASTTITNLAGVTPLHSAASRGDTNMATRLLGKGANPNVEDSEGKTPLFNALNSQRPVEMVRLLLARGADVNHRDVIRKPGSLTVAYYPLHYPILNGQQEVLETLLEAKPDLQVTAPNIGTPLLTAVDRDRAAMVESILRAGADPNFSSWDNPPLIYAVGRTPQIVAALLKHGADPNFVTQQGYTPMFGVTQPEILQLLLDHKADPNKGSNPLTELLRRRTSSGRVPPGPGVSSEPSYYPAIEVLLKGGANPNATFTDGKRLLTFAVNNRDVKLLSLLLKHGAEVNYVANNETPLSLAQHATRDPRSTSMEEWEQIEKALREHGANEYLQRLSTISYTRPAWTGGNGRTVFSRGTNDYNRHTLFEMLAAVFTGNDQPVFPDLSRVTIERLEGANPKRRELAINIDELLRAGDCSKDTWVEWGDRISFPETDHPLNEGWPGFSQETFELITKCLTRRVSIIVKQETNIVKLAPTWGQSGVMGFSGVTTFGAPPPGFPGRLPNPQSLGNQLQSLPIRPARQPGSEALATEKPEKVLHTFRLKELVYGANVLRASSDPTRVRVTRREGDKTKEWVFNLNRVATASESASGRLPTWEDLWLRDGDVIEIPEKP